MSQNTARAEPVSAGKGPLRGKLLADLIETVTNAGDILPGGVSVRMWQVYVHVWLACLIFPVATLVQLHPDTPHLALAVVGLVSFVAFYTWFMRQHPLVGPAKSAPRRSVTLLALFLVTLLGLSLSLMFGPTFLWLFVGTSMVAGRTLPLHLAHLIATVLPFLTIAMGLLLGGSIAGTDWLHILPLALLVRAMGLNMLGLSLQFGTIRDLRAAQKALAQQASTEERLRLARDLHDLLGHSLSLIVLKSELAGRLIEKEPAQAAKEIHELESVARQALREVRQAVANFRQPTLQGELDGARQMLTAAGMTFTVENVLEDVPPSVEGVLAWAVREGVTNVIRHSRARSCRLRFVRIEGHIQAELTNDGYFAPTTTVDNVSSGLSGLTERVAAQGGTLQASPCTIAGKEMFRLQVDLPMPVQSEKSLR